MKKRRKTLLAEFVRVPKYELRNLSELKVDQNKKTDHHFVRLYTKFLNGELGGILTRVAIEKILPSFFERAADGSIQQFDAAGEGRYIESEAYRIRCGFRPMLYLYRGRFGDTSNSFVCSDDVVTYHAYRKVGIRYVPAVLLGRPKRLLDESGIYLLSKDDTSWFDGTIALPRAKVASLIGSNSALERLGPLKAIAALKAEASRATQYVKAFHIDSDEEIIHYHHCLYSVAYRLVEALTAVDLLLRSRLEHQIRPLVRSTYELFLNFYLDWLSPEQVGLVMQSVALLARTDSKDPEYGNLEERVRRVFGGLANLCRNAAEKGRLSPLGSEIHERIYSGLSPIVHQDFGVAHEYGAALESGRPEKLDRKELLEIIRWLDIITAATIVRILDDVGAMTLRGRGSGPDREEG